MRIRLKDSVNMQVKYDENRKMLITCISHDLKTPITSIKGYVEGIIDGIANTEEKRNKYLDTVLSKTIQVDHMIDDLLLFSKLDLNQFSFNIEPVDIEMYMNDCLTENKSEFEKNHISLNITSDLTNKTFVYIDIERMKRVIMNILENSRKYMDTESGKIEILLRQKNSRVIIEMSDNGPGISEEHIGKIFDRFYRGDSARTNVSGSGLGLSISKQLVEGQNGKIWLISKPKEGTTVMISLKINTEE